MTTRIGVCVLASFMAVQSLEAQTQPQRQSPPAGRRVAAPGQPAARGNVPNIPTLERKQPPAAPFQLTPQQQAEVDQMLSAWERQSSIYRKFECTFTRFEYDQVFHEKDVPRYVDLGYIKYAAPDRGVFRVTYCKRGNNVEPIEPRRAEHWICDGRSIYGYDFVQKQLVEHKLPPELQGKAIANGPLPFLFGAQAERVKERYWVRIVTPPDRRKMGEVWLEAYPRFQADAANFKRAELILKTDAMQPFAMQLHLPTGQQRTVYQFAGVKVNTRDPADLLDLFPDTDFRAGLPVGWRKIVEEAPPTRETVRPATGPRR